MNATRRLSVRLTRRTSIRTTTSLGKVDVEKQQPKKEEQYNMNALVVKNLGYEDPTKGKTNVYYSYIENKYKQVENAENYLDILDIDESLLHKEDTLTRRVSHSEEKIEESSKKRRRRDW